MRPLLDDAALLHEEDMVRPGDRGQAVRDDEHDPVPLDLCQRGDEGAFRLRVERRGRLVEDQDRRIAHQAAGNGESLLLADGEGPAPTSEHGAVAVGQRSREGVCAADAGRPLHLVVRGSRPAQAQVLGDRPREKQVFLEDVGHLRAHRVHVQLAQVDTVEQHPSRGGPEEPRNHVREAGLAGPGGPDDRDGLAHPPLERDVPQRLPAVRVDQPDPVEDDAP